MSDLPKIIELVNVILSTSPLCHHYWDGAGLCLGVCLFVCFCYDSYRQRMKGSGVGESLCVLESITKLSY